MMNIPSPDFARSHATAWEGTSYALIAAMLADAIRNGERNRVLRRSRTPGDTRHLDALSMNSYGGFASAPIEAGDSMGAMTAPRWGKDGER